MNSFKEIDKTQLPFNPFEIKDGWMLVTAEKDGKANTMTASWGSFGVMWNKEVVFIVIRPQRYTKEFVDNADSFSLTFFDNSFKKQLGYLGKASGRDENKIEKAGLTITHTDGVPYFEEAHTTIVAKKLYVQRLGPEFFLDKEIDKRWYPENDHHYMYIAEVTKILKKDI